ncbi:TMEM165/GDT1 family protein [Sphingomonas sp. 1P06PA]|uniref:TMEM165/GDT1 family protein n=1 Tax=Sphingomonas sp. 1P06PA TaxID=554121 RepID=UPI0039A47925
MDALLTTFLAALVAELGDKSQLMALALVARFPDRRGAVLCGIAAGLLATALLAAAGGALVADLVNFRAVSLMCGLALIFAGITMFRPPATPREAIYDRLGAFGAAAFAIGVMAFGDRTQFLTFALAARADSVVLAGIGGGLGALAATLPVALAGRQLADRLPLRPMRATAGALLVLIGTIVALNALRLI